MHALRLAIGLVWILFWIGWVVSAAAAKQGTGGLRRFPLGGLSAVGVIVALRVTSGGFEVHSPSLQVLGTVLFVLGLALAVWARVYLGRNWGMPMTEKAEPELVTSGPYSRVRHPIYSGLILGVLGTGLALNLIDVIVAAVLAAYFAVSASVEEKNLAKTFPQQYPAYRERTKMIIPFVL